MINKNEYTIKEKKEFFDIIASKMPEAKRTKNGVLIPLDDNGSVYHITDIHKLNTPEHEKYGSTWFEYKIICNTNDLEKIINPKEPSDFLLKVRADSILDNMRSIRVFKKRFNNSEGMTLSKWYNNNDRINFYVDNISKAKREKIIHIPYGTAMIPRANAICQLTKKGNIIIVSERLVYSMYFFNIFLYGTSLGFTEQECFIAYTIALRTYYGHESIDFDLDPRGIFPTNVEEHLQKLTNNQYNFILGHEYAHHLLGHINSKNLVSQKLFNSESSAPVNHYKHRHKEEYDADWHSIKNIQGNNTLKDDMVNAAFSCFYFFYVLELVGESIAPQGNAKAKTHPPALDRMNQLRKKVKSSYGINKEYLEKVKGYVDQITDSFISSILPYNYDDFEKYGSYYFTRFKCNIMIDRFDY